MSSAGSGTVTLQLGELDSGDAKVLSLVGNEVLSRPFGLDVEFLWTGSAPLDAKALVGQRAHASLKGKDDSIRHWDGKVLVIRQLRVGPRGVHYRVRMGPSLELCRWKWDNRIFQGLNVPDILEAVGTEADVRFRRQLQNSYVAREYCVQYGESDLAFFQRLLAEDGLFYFFEHDDSRHALVLADSPSAYTDIARVPFHLPGGMQLSEESIFSLEHQAVVGPTKLRLRDYNFERPTADLETQKPAGEAVWEVYDYPGGYSTEAEGKLRAKRGMEAMLSLREVWRGKSTRSDLAPGCKLQLDPAPFPEWEGDYAVVAVTHRFEDGGKYENEFTLIRASVPFRTQADGCKRPRVLGAQTAKVVGLSGEEIYPERMGQVKVQFPWDREGENNEHSSCWVRVAQPWAGEGFGAQFIPRMGQEVVVRFLEGNPDRPLVVGAVYNGDHPTAVALPDNKTQSTQRTSSSLGGDGYNEFRFEDASGAEEVFLHAQRDKNIEVLASKSQGVGQHETLSVGKDRSRRVAGNQTLDVLQDDASAVGGNQMLTVGRNRDTLTTGSHREHVSGQQVVTVGQAHQSNVTLASAVTVGAASALNVGGVLLLNVALASNEAVGGLKSSQVVGASMEAVGGSRNETVGGKRSRAVMGDEARQVEGPVGMTTGGNWREDILGKLEVKVAKVAASQAKSVQVSADKLSLVVGGKLALSMTSSEIRLACEKIFVNGTELRFRAPKVKKEQKGVLAKKALDLKPAAEVEKGKGVVRAAFKGLDGKPALAGLKYEMKLPDGTTKKGTIGADGNIAASGLPPGDVELRFPELLKAGSSPLACQPSQEARQVEAKELARPLKLKQGEHNFAVKREVVPIIFVPGFAGSRLACNGEKVWDPDAIRFMFGKFGLLWHGPEDKQKILVGKFFDPDYLKAYNHELRDNEHNSKYLSGFPGAVERGWGGLYWDTYGQFVASLHAGRWQDSRVQAAFESPVYAFPYNWTASNTELGKAFATYIKEVIAQHADAGCQKVLLVTHSMGGLVARSANSHVNEKILGIVHGVQPVHGAGAAYWRMKAGFERADSIAPSELTWTKIKKSSKKFVGSRVAAWWMGTNGKEVNAVLANIPGGLELLPTKNYNGGSPWLTFADSDGKTLEELSLPKSDPYEEIYKKQGTYWELVNLEFLVPPNPLLKGQSSWDSYVWTLEKVQVLHDKLQSEKHPETHSFWGRGPENPTADIIQYRLSPYGWKEIGGQAVQIALKAAWAGIRGGPKSVAFTLIAEGIKRTDLWRNRGGFQTKIKGEDGLTYELVLQPPSGDGDGTVPTFSANALGQSGQSHSIEVGSASQNSAPAAALNGVEHQPAYQDYPEVKEYVFHALNQLLLYRLKDKS
jgi:type VI secretion system secreted protein VgrG